MCLSPQHWGSRDRCVLGTHWPASLAELVNSKSMSGTVSKKRSAQHLVISNQGWPLTSTGMLTHIRVYTQESIHTHIKKFNLIFKNKSKKRPRGIVCLICVMLWVQSSTRRQTQFSHQWHKGWKEYLEGTLPMSATCYEMHPRWRLMDGEIMMHQNINYRIRWWEIMDITTSFF